MIFKSSTVALMVSAVFAGSVNATEVQDTSNKLSAGQAINSANSKQDVKAPFNQVNEQSGVYLIRLSEKSALDQSYAKLGNDRSSIVSKIETQQDLVLDAIKQIDGTAILTRKSRMIENALYVQMSHQTVDAVLANNHVISAELLNEEASYTAEDEFKRFPFLTVKDPGDAVTVAIVGNGIDYTHASLGGEGTAEAYDKAWANRTNAWDGFPTDTIIGGLDFSAQGEGFHTIDYNPIEVKDDINVVNGALASGTAVAAQVLAEAPDAKILYYKTWDWNKNNFYPVLDVIVDPNQDGDISDRPDVIVMNSYGNSAFYVEDDTQGSQATRDIALVRRLSATGSLLVIGAGATYYDSYFNLAWRGAVPEALTVGSVAMNEDGASLSAFTPAGPTRGTQVLKPEVVGPAENFEGPVAGSGTETQVFNGHPSYAAAYAAGTAAKILDQYPNLSPLEAKALVTNTALSDQVSGSSTYVEDFDVTRVKTAEVPFMGSGLVDGATAITANAVVWDSSSYQPSIAYGFVEASSQSSISREITIKNLTNEVQSYALTSIKNGDKANNDAISFIFPDVVNVPANRSVMFTVTMSVDEEKLAAWPLKSTEDYTMDNWSMANVNGYLVFNDTVGESAQLKMPWQVFPKSQKDFDKANVDYKTGLPFESPIFEDYTAKSGGWVETTSIDVTNNTNENKIFYSMPLMHNIPVQDPSKAEGQGNQYKNIGATISPEAMCESGQKLSVAVQMFDKFDVPMAEHFDKAGHVLAYFSIYEPAISDKYMNDPLGLSMNSLDTEKLAYLEIILDVEGKPQTKYLDLGMEFSPWNLGARVKYSKLGADVSPGDDTAVANICLEDLYHDDFQSIDAWNQNLGWQFASDRDAQSSIRGPVIRYNPVLNGDYYEQIIDHTGEDGYPNWWDTNCQPKSWNPDNCIEKEVNFLAHIGGVTLLSEDDQTPGDWLVKQIVEPGQTARVSSGSTLQCNPNVVSTGNWITHEDCPPGVMFFEIGNENTSFSGATFGADPAIRHGQSFSVYENSENGTVIGKLDTTSNDFYSTASRIGEIYQVNSLPGTPFAIATDGTISVYNSDAINYEEVKSFVLKVHADYENRDSKVVDVVININNRNDIAPVMIASINAINTTQGEMVEVSVASAFTDPEGDGLAFTATNLPAGLDITQSGLIKGSTTQSGNFTATITATDGINSTSSNVAVTVAASSSPVTTPHESNSDDNATNSDQSSGGSTNMLFILLAAFGFVTRRVSK